MRKARVKPETFYGGTLAKRRVGDLVVVDSRHAAGSRISRHSHDRAYFCLNHGGTYTENYGRRTRVCRPGMLVFHPAGEVHSEDHDSAVASLNVELGEIWLHRMVEFAGPLDQPAEFFDDDIATAGFQLLQEFHRSDQDSELAIESLSWEILARSVARRSSRPRENTPRWLHTARDLLEESHHETLSLRNIAKQVGVHPV